MASPAAPGAEQLPGPPFSVVFCHDPCYNQLAHKQGGNDNEKDLDGRITALKTNIGEVNRLKTDILNIINDEILALDHSDIGIPMGSLLLPELLSGRGPSIPVHILSIRNSDANFVSHFSQAGINQTLHQVTMQVSIDVAVLVLGRTSSFTMCSEVLVAETVLVGDVPDTYLQTGGNYGSEK